VDEIELLRNGDSKTIEKIYQTHRKAFLSFGAKYNLSTDDLLDVYQDSIIAFIENIKKGHLDNLKSEVKTYLFSIGKYLIFKQLKEKSNNPPEEITDKIEWFEIDDENAEISQIEHALAQLGEQCYKILKLFYYEEKKLDEILQILPYENKDVLKSQKSRCLKQLKKILGK
jgi:RNA polymerase sigma factor (sigma-70 family)